MSTWIIIDKTNEYTFTKTISGISTEFIKAICQINPKECAILLENTKAKKSTIQSKTIK